MCGGDMCGARVETECQLLPSRHQQSRHTGAGATHLQLARTDINIHTGALGIPEEDSTRGLVLFWALT